MSCAGSIIMEAPFPNTNSDHSDNGTACHIVAAHCLQSNTLVPSDWLLDKVLVSDPDEKPRRYVEWTEDLCTMTTEYVDTIKALTKDRELHVEKRVRYFEEEFGTIDAHWLEPFGLRDQYEICICDLKTGYKFVGTDSPQLKCYALGVYSLYDLSHDIAQVRLMIFQPRHGGMREEVISVAELMEFAEKLKLASAKIDRATEGFSGFDDALWQITYLNPNPNEEECAFCRALATCPAARAKLEETVGQAFDTIDEATQPAAVLAVALGEADALGAEVDTYLGKLMSATGFLEDWIKAVRAEVERKLMLGEAVEGYGLELGRQGARAWTDEAEAEKMVREQFRIKAELAYKMKLHSPTQLEKLATITKPSTKNPNPTKPAISKRQWEKLQPLIVRSDAVPSVKPTAQIKVPYSVTKADESAFEIVDGTELY